MTNIANALAYNSTIMNNKAATIDGGQIGVEDYGSWKTALENAHRDFYKYECAIITASINPEKSAKDATVQAFNSLQAILDLVGEVNGHTIRKSVDLLNVLAKYSMVDKKERIGNAMLIQSQIKNLRAELRDVNDGVPQDWIDAKEKELNTKMEELRLADKRTDSASKYNARAKYGVFATKMECALAKIIKGQEAKTWEELEAEEQARKDAARARRKAKRQSNKK